MATGDNFDPMGWWETQPGLLTKYQAEQYQAWLDAQGDDEVDTAKKPAKKARKKAQ